MAKFVCTLIIISAATTAAFSKASLVAFNSGIVTNTDEISKSNKLSMNGMPIVELKPPYAMYDGAATAGFDFQSLISFLWMDGF